MTEDADRPDLTALPPADEEGDPRAELPASTGTMAELRAADTDADTDTGTDTVTVTDTGTVTVTDTATGAAPKPSAKPKVRRASTDADLGDGPRPRRRWVLVLGLGTTLLAASAVIVVLGQVHATNYALRCGAKEIVAERGRSVPPWGYERLGGPSWRPIAIPPDAECTARETEDVVQLEGWFLEALVEQATRKLSGAAPGDLDRAEAELAQALLLSRSPERRDQRKDLERLRGDVTYWRAVAKVKAAVTSLEDAARGFDDATAQRPRHASDPTRWSTFARATAAALDAGPDGTGVPSPIPTSPSPSRPTAPPGIALPIDSAPYPIDAGALPDDAARRDLPSGGVLM